MFTSKMSFSCFNKQLRPEDVSCIRSVFKRHPWIIFAIDSDQMLQVTSEYLRFHCPIFPLRTHFFGKWVWMCRFRWKKRTSNKHSPTCHLSFWTCLQKKCGGTAPETVGYKIRVCIYRADRIMYGRNPCIWYWPLWCRKSQNLHKTLMFPQLRFKPRKPGVLWRGRPSMHDKHALHGESIG